MKTIEEKAKSHVMNILEDVAGKAKNAPWNEFLNVLEDIYLAGAKESLEMQWRDPGDGLPENDRHFIVCFRTKYRGSWLTLYVVDQIREWHEHTIFQDKDKEVINWMYLPVPPGVKRYQ